MMYLKRSGRLVFVFLVVTFFTFWLLDQGKTLGFGKPSEVLTEHAVSSAFQVGTRAEMLMPSNNKHLTFHLQNQGTPQ